MGRLRFNRHSPLTKCVNEENCNARRITGSRTSFFKAQQIQTSACGLEGESAHARVNQICWSGFSATAISSVSESRIRASRLTARKKAPFSGRVSTTGAALFYGGWRIDNAANKSFPTGRRRRNGG